MKSIFLKRLIIPLSILICFFSLLFIPHSRIFAIRATQNIVVDLNGDGEVDFMDMYYERSHYPTEKAVIFFVASGILVSILVFCGTRLIKNQKKTKKNI